jgi:phage terminase large subunit-like protein
VEAVRGHYASADGPSVKQLYPRDPAEAGKTAGLLRVSAAIEAGAAADTIPATKNVLSKAEAVSSAAHPRSRGLSDEPGNYGKIRVVRGEWNDPFFDILEGFPKARHDDDVSALADAYNDLMSAPGWIPPVAPARMPVMRFANRRGFG